MSSSDRPRGLGALVSLVTRVVRDAKEDRISGVAAEVAFFALLGLGPLLLVLASAAGLIAGWIGASTQADLQERVITALGGFLSADATEEVVRPIVDGVFGGTARGGVLSVGVLLALWSGSRLIKVVIEALNIAYDVEEWRSAWVRRVTALWLTLGGILAIVVYLPFVIAGPLLGRAIDDWTGVGSVFETTWRALYWPLAAVGGIALLTTLYHVAPNWKTRWRRDVPGALIAAALWVAAAFGLRIYVSVAVTDTAFGPLAAPIVLMLWLYVSALAVLVGAEVNAEIEKLWPSPHSEPKASRIVTAARARVSRVAGRLKRDGDEEAREPM